MVSAQVEPLPGMDQANLNWLFTQLHNAYGDLGWWPAQSRFEMIVGAVLVQNTAWRNVEQAISALKTQSLLSVEAICRLPEAKLAQVIRPAGYFNVKARRLKNLCFWWQAQCHLDSCATDALREGLLSVNGIGPETADAILLYAFDRPVFVIDAYTRRILVRLGWLSIQLDYEALRAVFERTLPQDSALFGQYHALLVEHAKQYCRSRPACSDCPLLTRCYFGSSHE